MSILQNLDKFVTLADDNLMKKILVVEDEPAYLKLLNDLLTRKGYKVIEAVDGKKGLDMAISENPDLILLDIMLPVMDGMTMLHELRKTEKGKLMKVIVLTNLDPNPDLIKKTIADQPTYYLIKSDTKLSELTAKIEELI